MKTRGYLRRDRMAACLVMALASCHPTLRAPSELLPAADGAPADARRDTESPDGPLDLQLPQDATDAPNASDGADASPCPLLAFDAVADSYVSEELPSANFGDATTLYIDGDANEQSYLRFAVAGVQGVVAATYLRINVKNATEDGPTVHTADNAWEESSITWENRPLPSATPLRDLGGVPKGWVDLDIGQAVQGNGEFTFVLVPTSSDGMDFASREDGDSPQLVLAVCALGDGGAAR